MAGQHGSSTGPKNPKTGGTKQDPSVVTPTGPVNEVNPHPISTSTHVPGTEPLPASGVPGHVPGQPSHPMSTSGKVPGQDPIVQNPAVHSPEHHVRPISPTGHVVTGQVVENDGKPVESGAGHVAGTDATPEIAVGHDPYAPNAVLGANSGPGATTPPSHDPNDPNHGGEDWGFPHKTKAAPGEDPYAPSPTDELPLPGHQHRIKVGNTEFEQYPEETGEMPKQNELSVEDLMQTEAEGQYRQAGQGQPTGNMKRLHKHQGNSDHLTGDEEEAQPEGEVPDRKNPAPLKTTETS